MRLEKTKLTQRSIYSSLVVFVHIPRASLSKYTLLFCRHVISVQSRDQKWLYMMKEVL